MCRKAEAYQGDRRCSSRGVLLLQLTRLFKAAVSVVEAVSASLMSLDRFCLPVDLPDNGILIRAASSAVSVGGEPEILFIGSIWFMYHVLLQPVGHALLPLVMVEDNPHNPDCSTWDFQQAPRFTSRSRCHFFR